MEQPGSHIVLNREAGHRDIGSDISNISRCVKSLVTRVISDFNGCLTNLPRIKYTRVEM